MLDGLAPTYAETREGPRGAGVAEPCNTLPRSASDECRWTPGAADWMQRRHDPRRNASEPQHRNQIESGDHVRTGRALFNSCETMLGEYAPSVASVDSYRH